MFATTYVQIPYKIGEALLAVLLFLRNAAVSSSGQFRSLFDINSVFINQINISFICFIQTFLAVLNWVLLQNYWFKLKRIKQ